VRRKVRPASSPEEEVLRNKAQDDLQRRERPAQLPAHDVPTPESRQSRGRFLVRNRADMQGKKDEDSFEVTHTCEGGAARFQRPHTAIATLSLYCHAIVRNDGLRHVQNLPREAGHRQRQADGQGVLVKCGRRRHGSKQRHNGSRRTL
jgi:hypothetical protein